MRQHFNEFVFEFSKLTSTIDAGYEDHEMILLESNGLTYFATLFEFNLADGDKPVTLESIRNQMSQAGWADWSFNHYLEAMVQSSDS